MTGRAALIVVLGIGALMMILMMNIRANTDEGLANTIDYYEETNARLIANSGIEIYLAKLRSDKTLSGTFLNNSLLEGTYDVSISGPDTNILVQSTATFQGASHYSYAYAEREPIGLPDVYGALYVNASNSDLKMNGNCDINGVDHDINGNVVVGGDSLPGVAVDDVADSVFWMNDLKTKISNQIDGEDGPPSIHTVVDNNDWEALTQNYIFAADTILTTGTYAAGTVLGTVANPIITYVEGDVHFSGTAEGAGIMVVNGDLTMSGNFTYRGILIAYGQSTIETQIVGNGGVFGSTILVGETVDIQSVGNSAFYYSSAAIALADANLKSSRFNIVRWWE